MTVIDTQWSIDVHNYYICVTRLIEPMNINEINVHLQLKPMKLSIQKYLNNKSSNGISDK